MIRDMAFQGRIPREDRQTLALKERLRVLPRHTLRRIGLAVPVLVSQPVLAVLWGVGWILLDAPYLTSPRPKTKRHTPTTSAAQHTQF